MPIDWTQFGTYAASEPAGARNKTILQNSTRYLIGPKYASTYTAYAPDGYLNLGGTGEAHVRYPAMTALATATALKFGVYDPRSLSTSNATVRDLNLIRTIAARHKSNNTDTSTAWGYGWQTSLWAYYDGLAAWLMWDQLSTTDQTKVANMIAAEADRLASGNDLYLVGTSGNKLYMTLRDGTAVTPGDSKAEENNWSAELLGLAAAMMPQHRNAADWRDRNIELLLAAAARPADLTRKDSINGIVPGTWLRGTNINDDGTLYNHNILHPLYMVAFDQSLDQGAVFALAGGCAPRIAKHNLQFVYDALVDKEFVNSDGTATTIYQPGSASIYYPQGNDWGTQFPGYFGAYDLLTSLYGLDRKVAEKADGWEELHNNAQIDLQNRFTDGRTYANSSENSYGGAEQRIGVLAAHSYLALFLNRNTDGNAVCWS
ncbi:hypothetical protein OH809_05110 [Streptomyces sp. NBC_00873]|uniref:hypothetical protein n=1 Tax=unclassified Streptomyces TaxID=2593676 RepID=UPI003864F051|nr:hypothetical protein OH809_05110 [Streptomyces sp. NBC_00873]WTA47785.1 hypothetical protein OH821_38680 [Streptomyces sp. NBC_00842]